MNCPKCGNEVTEQGAYCGSCGKKIVAAGSKNKRGFAAIFVVAVICTALIIF